MTFTDDGIDSVFCLARNQVALKEHLRLSIQCNELERAFHVACKLVNIHESIPARRDVLRAALAETIETGCPADALKHACDALGISAPVRCWHCNPCVKTTPPLMAVATLLEQALTV